MISGERFTVQVKQHGRGFFDQKERWNAQAIDASGTVYVGVFPAFGITRHEHTTIKAIYDHTGESGEVYVKRVKIQKTKKDI